MRAVSSLIIRLVLALAASGAASAATLVGRVAGEFAFAPGGAATYAIPIQVAAGLNGLRPAVTLAYDSHGGDGLAGMGWTLRGFAEIRRCPLTRAVDGRTRGVRLDAQDRFCLDGEPLILSSGSYGGDGAQYRTEVHGHERVFSWGRQGSGPAWFEVRRPDGTVERYGNDADSRVEAPGTAEVRAWALNEIEDRFQQRIGFGYVEDTVNGEHRPSEVRWTYGAGESPQQARFRLAFGYAARPTEDQRGGFLWGTPWRSSQRLVSIDYEASSGSGLARVHRYSLAYSTPVPSGTQRSQLASVTQCGPRDCLPPTTLLWDDGVAGWNSWVNLYQPVDGTVAGDFNGDGATDLFGNDNGYWSGWPADPVTGESGYPVAIGAVFGADGSGLALDFNGDGYTDLLARPTATANWVAHVAPGPAGSGFTAIETGVGSAGNGETIALDADGDGFDDLVYLRNGTAWLRRNLGGGFGPELASGIGPVSAPLVAAQGTAGWIASADFDGDSREDLLVARSRDTAGKLVWEAFLSNGTGFDAQPVATLGSTASADDVIVLDMNGDGLADVLRRNDSYWTPYISRGTRSGSYAGLMAAACSAPLSAGSGRNTAAVDYDGDGRSDLLVPYGTAWRIYRSDGNCFSRSARYADLAAPKNTTVTRVVAVDRDGDGNGEILLGTTFRDWHALQHRRGTRGDGTTAARGDLLREITDGLGNSHVLDHRPLAGWDGYRLIDAPAPAASRLLGGGPLVVLAGWSASNGAGGRNTVTLDYANLRQDGLGRGLLGFRLVRAEDSATGLVTETAFRQDFPFTGRPETVTTWSGQERISAYDPAWSVASTAAPDAALDTHFVHLASELTETYEVDDDGGYRGNLVRSEARTLTWNSNHGAVTSEQVTISAPQEGGVTHRSTRSVTLDESLRSSAGCHGFPNRVDVTRGTVTRTVQYAWHATTCRLLTETEGPAGDPARQLRTSYAYDALGRLESTSRADGAGNQPARVTRFAYASGGSRPTSVARVISGETDLVTTHAWNEGLGLEISRSEPAGTTRWGHDDFGRVRSEARPSGNTSFIYGSCGPCYAPQARWTLRQARSDGYWTETQHDARGRVVGRGFVLPGNQSSRQVVEYDAAGRLARESVPYRSDAGQVYWTGFAYDALGRIKSIDRPVSETTPSGGVTTFTYAGIETTVRDAELRLTELVHDAEGRLKLIAPPLGSNTGYTWTAHGQLASIVDAGWNGARFSYDERGRLVQSLHPDSGRRDLGYNVFGELVSQADGKTPANTMSLQYDQLGRPTRRTEPEGTTTWTYVASGPARGRLEQVTGPTAGSPTGFRESHAYDSLARLQRTTTVIDGSSYETAYTYDAEGKMTTMTYPTTVGWRPKFVYGYSAGHLVSILQQGATLTRVYTLLGLDGLGRETAAQFGAAAIEERNVYDAASTRLAAIRSGAPSSLGSIQDYAYEWDRVGNLLGRRSNGPGPALDERFGYDALNRLTQVTLNGATTLTMSYSQDGNIRSKSDVGNYGYGQSGILPHAVASITGGPRGAMSFAYDANGNMTSRNGTAIAWTSYNLPRQVTTGGDYARFDYGPTRARVRQDSRSGGTDRTTHYVGPHFEVEYQGGNRRYRSNVFAYGRAVYSQVEATPNGLEAYYVLHDHLGSVDRLARAAGTGGDTLALAFDAWGKRRNADWKADPADQRYADAHWTERGFTGHEHLDTARLVHMNGRLEDPLLGRMLSPDPVLANLENPQGLNPYSYVANGPTSHADPSGYFLSKARKTFKRAVRHIGSTGRRVVRRWGRQVAAAVAAYYTAGFVSSWAYGAQTAGVSMSGPALFTADGIAAAGTLGTASSTSFVIGGAAGGAVAGAIGSGSLRGAAAGALAGGAMGGIAAHFGAGHSAGRVLAEATTSGVAAELEGGDFGDGFLAGGALSSLTWASIEMRQAMIEQSKLNPTGVNASGVSDGFRGDGFKLGGCRFPCSSSPLGGVQGRVGSFLGHRYAPGSFLDHLVETYAGPHDYLNSPFFYDGTGNLVGRPRVLGVVNAVNVLVATPFAAASVVPPYAYAALDD